MSINSERQEAYDKIDEENQASSKHMSMAANNSISVLQEQPARDKVYRDSTAHLRQEKNLFAEKLQE